MSALAVKRPLAPSGRRRRRFAALEGLLGLAGLGAGVAGAVLAYDRRPSAALAVFVFAVASHVVGRAAPRFRRRRR